MPKPTLCTICKKNEATYRIQRLQGRPEFSWPLLWRPLSHPATTSGGYRTIAKVCESCREAIAKGLTILDK